MRFLRVTWSEYLDKEQIFALEKSAYLLHLITGVVVGISSLSTLLTNGRSS